MIRDDILRLSDDALADLTNRGTLRRARKEIDEQKVLVRIEQGPDGAVVAEAEDGTRCELLPGRPFGDWTCTCLAAGECRHLVRAVIAYRAQHDGGVAEQESPGRDDVEETPTVETFDPATITDEQLAAALPAATIRAARRWLEDGALGHVGVARGLTVVRIHHPTPATVRFLSGPDLDYARCSCRRPDPCAHVVVAVALSKGRAWANTGLRSLDGDSWLPAQDVLDEAEALVHELIRVGLEADHRFLGSRWERLRGRARHAGLHHVAGLVEDLRHETGRYVHAENEFDPLHVLTLLGELLARCASLRGTHSERVPDRLVAGSGTEESEVGKARFIGMGVEAEEAGDECILTVHLVDARSGAPLRVVRRITNAEGNSTARLARRLVSGAPIAHWGGGQVLVSGGRYSAQGDFTPGRQVTVLPKDAVEQLVAPYLSGSLSELSTHHSHLSAILDDRAAGTSLAAVPFSRVESVGFDTGSQQLRADLVDAEGAVATLALARTRWREGVESVGARLLDWAEEPPETLFVAGRWRWTGHGVVVDPFLLVGDDVAIQPHVAERTVEGDRVLMPPRGRSLGSPAALVHAIDEALGRTLLAGLDRLDTATVWSDLIARASSSGSAHLVGLMRRVEEESTPESVAELLLTTAFARPLL